MKYRTFFLIALLTVPWMGTPVEAQSLSKLFLQVDHSVVVIRTEEKQISSKKEKGLVNAQGVGSGVLISDDGKIMTAAHLVHIANTVKVEFWDGQIVPAHVIASAPEADVALLQLERVPDDVSSVELGNSDGVQIGDEIFVIGTPYGFSHTLTAGHISARHKLKERDEELASMEMFQTDAAINMGNSGGPLFDLEGRVVGIVSRILSQSGGDEGLGFAVTSNIANRLLLEEKSYWVGFASILLTEDLARIFNLPQPAGLLIQQVAEGSPAALLGLKPGTSLATINDKNFLVGGDIILSMEEMPVSENPAVVSRLHAILNKLQPGDTVNVKVLRGGKIIELSTVI